MNDFPVRLRIGINYKNQTKEGAAGRRDSIFRPHMPLVLEDIFYVDRAFFSSNRIFMKAHV